MAFRGHRGVSTDSTTPSTHAIDEILGGRVLPFDRSAAESAAKIAASQRQVGRPVGIRDVPIPGIANVRKATLATHDTRHFVNLDVVLVDPGRPYPAMGFGMSAAIDLGCASPTRRCAGVR
jgi:hypothetical protein